MKRIFHRGEALAKLPFFATLGLAILLWGGTYAYTQSLNTRVKSNGVSRFGLAKSC